MFRWALGHIVWLVIRVVVTLVCCLTIKSVVHTEGYYLDLKVLLVSAACLIVGVRFWMPRCDCNKKSPQETTWGSHE